MSPAAQSRWSIIPAILDKCSERLNDRPRWSSVVAMITVTPEEVTGISSGYDSAPERSMSLRAEAYTDPKWAQVDLQAIFRRTWQWVCHVEKLSEPGNYVTAYIADMPVVVVRDRSGELRAYVSWGYADDRWGWGNPAAPITPDGEKWGELTFRRMAQGKWVLGGFLASKYALGYRVVDSPVANMHTTEIQVPIVGSSWEDENQSKNTVAQLYGGYVLPGSRFDIQGGFGLGVSQWNTAAGWPYRAMQFKAPLRDTTKTRQPPDPTNL